MRSPSPPPPVRGLLVAEVAAYLAGLAGYIWLLMPPLRMVRWDHVAFYAAAIALPIAANLLHGDRPADSGLRLDNLGASVRLALPATAAMAAFVAAVGWISGGFHWVGWTRLGELVAGYASWGLAQQYLVQSFALRRLRQAGLPVGLAAVAAAGGFALLHAPNWVLVGLSFAAALVWCSLFLRRGNILILGLAHGVLAVLLFHAWPVSWMHSMTIGPAYILRCKGL